jgi:hypothetical protein
MPDAVDQISYEDLCVRREQGKWRATEIDFSVDREQRHIAFRVKMQR